MQRVANSVEQTFGGNVIKQGDETPFGFILRDENGTVIDLQGTTVNIKLANRDTLVLEKTAIINADNVITFALTSDDVTGYGDMRVEFVVTYADATKEKFPADGWQKITITPSLDNVQIGGIAYVTVQSIQAKADEALTKSTNAENTANLVQTQFDQVVGASTIDPAVEQMMVDTEGVAHPSPDARLRSDYEKVNQQLAQRATKDEVALKADKTYVDTVKSGTPKIIKNTLTELNAAYPTGSTDLALIIGNVKEVASLTVTAVPTVAGNVTVTLNGVATNIVVDPATETTTALVATKIRNTVFPNGVVTGGTGSTVTFTASVGGVKTDATYSAGSTGATGTMTTTTQGVDPDGKWYYWNGSAWTAGGTYQSSGIALNSISYDTLAIDIQSIMSKTAKNLYNPSLAIDGKYAGYFDGAYIVSADYITSGRIPVLPGKTYTISEPSSNILLSNVNCYNASNVYLGVDKVVSSYPVASGVTVTSKIANGRSQLTITIAQDSLVRFIEVRLTESAIAHNTAYFDTLRNSVQMEFGTDFTTFEAYDPTGKIKINQTALPPITANNDVLYGKILATAGDSITYGADMDAAGIDTDGSLLTYGKLTAKRNNMTFYNYGISGSTMQNIVGKNGFSDTRYQTMTPNIDYLTIWFGWNDAAYGTLGTINDTTDQSFYGGWNEVIPWIIQNYPTTKIGLIVPFGATAGHRQAVRDIGDKFGLPYLDLYAKNTPLYYGKEETNPELDAIITQRRSTFQAVGAHPNSKGHAYLSTIFEDFLRRL